MMLGDVSDEALMAYADGELATAETEMLRIRLVGDPVLRERLAAFVVTRDLGRAFDEIMSRPLPAKLQEVLAAPDRPASAGAPARGLLQSLADFFAPTRGPWTMGVALSTCLLVGTATGWMASQLVSGSTADAALLVAASDGSLDAGPVLAATLESQGSDSTVSGSGGAGRVMLSMQPISSFRSKDGRICREFGVRIGDGAGGIEGVACRGTAGHWKIEAQTATGTVRVAAGKTAGAKIATAGANDVLDPVIDRLLTGAVFDREQEKRWLDKGWKQP